METSNTTQSAALGVAGEIIDDAWDELKGAPHVQARLGFTRGQLPDVSFDWAERRSAVGQDLLRRLKKLDLAGLPHETVLTLRLVHFRASVWAREADWYWTVLDPRGSGQFGLFLPTAYCGGYLLNLTHRQFSLMTLREPADADLYLTLVEQYGRLIDQFAMRTAGQAVRGTRMPQAQVLQARSLLNAFKSGARAHLAVPSHHDPAPWVSSLARAVEGHIATYVEPAFNRA